MKISRWPILYSNGDHKIFLWELLEDAKKQPIAEISTKKIRFRRES
jgi:hypothetical protein